MFTPYNNGKVCGFILIENLTEVLSLEFTL